MFCPECGQKNDDGNKVCFNCGAQLIDNSNDLGSISSFDFDKLKSDVGKATGFVKKTLPSKESIMQNKKKLIPFGAAMAVVLCIIVLFSIGKSINSPKKVALKYFDAVFSEQYEKAFSYVNLSSESDGQGENLVTADMYANYMRNRNSQMYVGEILNREIMDNEYGENNNLKKEYTINYVSSSYSDSGYYSVKLVKTGKKKLLFFDEYKVLNDSLPVLNNITLVVPNGASVTIDNIELKNYVLDEEDHTQRYVISQIIGYDHIVKVFGNSVEETSKTYSFENGDEETISCRINKKFNDALIKKINDSLKALVSGAAIKKPFSELGVDQAFNDVYLSLQNTFDSEKIKSATVTEVDIDKDDDGTLYTNGIDVYTRISYVKEWTSSWSGKTETSEYTGSLDYEIGLYYDVESASWEIENVMSE